MTFNPPFISLPSHHVTTPSLLFCEKGIKGVLVGASPDVYGCHPLQLNLSASGTFVLIQRSPLDTQATEEQVKHILT